MGPKQGPPKKQTWGPKGFWTPQGYVCGGVLPGSPYDVPCFAVGCVPCLVLYAVGILCAVLCCDVLRFTVLCCRMLWAVCGWRAVLLRSAVRCAVCFVLCLAKPVVQIQNRDGRMMPSTKACISSYWLAGCGESCSLPSLSNQTFTLPLGSTAVTVPVRPCPLCFTLSPTCRASQPH